MISNRRKIRLTLKSGSSFHEVESRGVRFGYRERDTERQRERFVVLSPHRKRGEGERETKGRFRKTFTKNRKGKGLIVHQLGEFHRHALCHVPTKSNQPPPTPTNILILFSPSHFSFWTAPMFVLRTIILCYQPKFMVRLGLFLGTFLLFLDI